MASDARRGPFDRLRPAAIVAATYLALVVVWIVSGTRLPGGRWLAVHFFTLGVLTNLILALSDHFARTLTRQPGEAPSVQLLVVNTGAIAVFVGVATGRPWWVAVGATAISATVVASYRRLRRLRRTALGPRFGWIVRMYERAHGAFLHGAVLGALLGTGILGGRWVGAVRTAHLHVNILGWAGITLLATIVFFGPTIARTRIEEGADLRAARALPLGTTGLSVAVLALVATGFAGVAGQVARGVAASGLAVFASSVTIVCVPVIRSALRSTAPERWSVLAVAAWFVPMAWSDAVLVGAGAWRFLEPIGAGMLLGVLAQSIVAAGGYIAPRLLHLDPATALPRTEALAVVRASTWNAGTLLVVGAAIAASPIGSLGWALVIASAVMRALVVVWAAARRG